MRRKLVKRQRKFIVSAILILLSLFPLFAQDLPNKIRGYKVYKQTVSVKNNSGKSSSASQNNPSETLVKIGDPKLSGVSPSGITLEIPAEISNLPESGKVDFLTFYDFHINGLAVEIEDYKESFSLVKSQPLKLSKPLKISIGTTEILRGAFREISKSKNEWQVSGRVFVFGRFKKYGFTFKRVVPVEINLEIKNPLLQGFQFEGSAKLTYQNDRIHFQTAKAVRP